MEWRALLQQNNGYMIIVHHLLGVVFAESASHSHEKEPSSKTTFRRNETRYKEQTTYIQLGNDGDSTRSRKETALEES